MINSTPLATGDEPRVDNPVDAWMIAYSGAAGKPVEGPTDKPYAGFDGGWGMYGGRYDVTDALDAKHGNFSMLFTVRDPAKETAFGCCSGPDIHHWALTPEFSLRFWAKTLWMNCISQGTPKIGDEYVDYNCPAMDSPYLQGASRGGVITLTGPISGKKLVFGFNKIERRGKE